jgi:diadenylate cyclase
MIAGSTTKLPVRLFETGTRDEILAALVEMVSASLEKSPEGILQLVQERENTLSSRVSATVAIPHAICDGVPETQLAVGVCPAGVDWDGRSELVRLVILLVGTQEKHLDTMSAVARRLQAPGMVDALVNAETEHQIRALFSGHDSTVAPVEARTLTVTSATVHHASELARALPDNPVVVATSNPGVCHMLGELLEEPLARRTFLVGPGLSGLGSGQGEWKNQMERICTAGVRVVPTDRLPEDRFHTAALTLLPLLATGAIRAGSEVILVSGRGDQGGLDAVRLVDVSRELHVPEGLAESHLPTGVRLEVVIRALYIVAELAAQGREGKPVGTIIVIGDDPRLEQHVQQMILNPFAGYSAENRNILDPSLDETIKELAKIDGAFLVNGDGTLRSAGTHLAGRPDPAEMDAGLGARHAAALGITSSADVLAICLSESTGTITLFHGGRRLIRR